MRQWANYFTEYRSPLTAYRYMSQRPCPLCERLFDPEQSPALPFCSIRCRLADLNRWFNQGYGLPYESPEEYEERPAPPEEGD